MLFKTMEDSAPSSPKATPPLRVLFVDDDQSLLKGLVRSCYSLNQELEVTTALGPEEGLKILEAKPFDALVTDLHMPGMNGAELLQQVRERHPSVLRFVLSGEAKPEIFLKASSHALQCFSKPCDVSIIISAISEAVRLLAEIPDKNLTQLLTSLGGMPACTATLQTLHKILNDPMSDVSDVVEGVRKSPGLVARLLKVANSPFFGHSGRVSTLDDAIGLLGMDSVASMIGTQQLFQKIAPASASGISVDELWQHSSFCSGLVRTLGPKAKIPYKLCREAVTAALLHDIGKLVMACANPSGYSAAITRSMADRIPLWQAEHPIFQCSHAEVGSKLLKLWGFPEVIHRSVACHHTPHRDGSAAVTPAALIHVGDYIAHHLSQSKSPYLLDSAYLASVNLPSKAEEWLRLLPS